MSHTWRDHLEETVEYAYVTTQTVYIDLENSHIRIHHRPGCICCSEIWFEEIEDPHNYNSWTDMYGGKIIDILDLPVEIQDVESIEVDPETGEEKIKFEYQYTKKIDIEYINETGYTSTCSLYLKSTSRRDRCPSIYIECGCN